MRWLGGDKKGLANTIESNKTSKIYKAWHTKFPGLDDLVFDFINRSESFLSDHRFGCVEVLLKVELLSLQRC